MTHGLVCDVCKRPIGEGEHWVSFHDDDPIHHRDPKVCLRNSLAEAERLRTELEAARELFAEERRISEARLYQIDKLHKQLAISRLDSERLDWLDAQFDVCNDADGSLMMGPGAYLRGPKPLRSAIDASRATNRYRVYPTT